MFPTVEVRWFFENEPFPPAVCFSNCTPGERTDWYAHPCHRHSGIKLREGRLETKLLVEALGQRQWGDATGNVERWQKWSAELESDGPSEEQLKTAGWVGVTKLRYLRNFSVEGSAVREVATSPETGVQLEWTKVATVGQTVGPCTWWTVGFESFGQPSQLERNLTAAAEYVLGSVDLPAELTSENSFGYPHWLGLME